MNRKNIIFYFSDQQRWDTLNQDVMPNLTDFAQGGITYENCFTCQPVCGPARACLQTGVYATQCGCNFNGIPLPDDRTHLAELFNDAGYDTAYIGKWHLASDRFPGIGFHCEKTAVPKEKQGGYRYWRAADILEFTSHGYDGYIFDGDGNKLDFKGYRADCINDFAIEYLDNRPKDKPFFMFVSQIEPHHQNDRGRYEGKKEYIEEYKKYPLPDDLTFLKGDYEKNYPDYLAAIRAIDENLAKLIGKLREQEILDDTVIIYTSDHGSHFKTRNLEYKRSCHDSCTHTPLVIVGGDFCGGRKEERLVSLIDLPVTMLSIADIPVPDEFMGRDLKKQLDDPADERDCVFMQISESQVGRAVRTKEYKYAIRSGGGEVRGSSKYYFEAYLYDLTKDPCEKHNLIKSPAYREVRKKMKALLLREMENAGEEKPTILPAIAASKK